MKSFILALFLLGSTTLTVLAVSGYSTNGKSDAKDHVAIIEKEFKRPVVELVFALDTTGSMSGLINASKEKIWSIASTMAQAQPAPEIRIGLVAYRDRGDDYVTKIVPLSSDLDAVYAQLLDFSAAGGGDGPESVNEALYKAVNNIQWSQSSSAYKAIFLVGDAPGHHDYQDDVPYTQSVKAAMQKGIIVNTIQAGNNRDMKSEWQKIAAIGQGDTFQVNTTGEAFAVTTPFDKKIAEASRRLDATKIFYGSAEEQAKAEKRKKNSEKVYAESSMASQARRAKYNLSDSASSIASKEKELLQAIERGEVELDEIAEAELPQSIAEASSSTRKQVVEGKLAERKAIKAELAKLSEERQAYIKTQREKLGAGKKSLDDKLLATLKEQAMDKGLKYDKENDY